MYLTEKTLQSHSNFIFKGAFNENQVRFTRFSGASNCAKRSKFDPRCARCGSSRYPSDPKALTKAINEASPDAEKYPTTMAAYELGKRLYFDPRLSKSGIISCNTCHNLGLGGADGVPASTGHKWTPNLIT